MIELPVKNYSSNLLAGSHKSRFYLKVDVDTILSDLMAIRLQQCLKRLQIEKITKYCANLNPRKRHCTSIEATDLPTKRKRAN